MDTQMAIIDLGEAQKVLMNDPLWTARGKAIQAYANLEQSLASFLAFLSDTDPMVASTIFFKVTSADSRNKILEKLFRQKFQARYNLFRNTLFDQLRPIDIERNSIVHWNAVADVGHDGQEMTASLQLRPPATLRTSDTPSLTTTQINEFANRCGFYGRLLNMFTFVEGPTQNNLPAEDASSWRDIFSQPIIYPPPSDHPLFQIPPEHLVLIQAYRL
jgi:hypothetical protein